MEEIKERAARKSALLSAEFGISEKMVKALYIAIAEEQRAIDSEKAWQRMVEQKATDSEKAWRWIIDWVFENAPHEVFDELMSSREDYIKSMEE